MSLALEGFIVWTSEDLFSIFEEKNGGEEWHREGFHRGLQAQLAGIWRGEKKKKGMLILSDWTEAKQTSGDRANTQEIWPMCSWKGYHSWISLEMEGGSYWLRGIWMPVWAKSFSLDSWGNSIECKGQGIPEQGCLRISLMWKEVPGVNSSWQQITSPGLRIAESSTISQKVILGMAQGWDVHFPDEETEVQKG